MSERIKNLRERRLAGSFFGLAAVLLSFSLSFAGCDAGLAGTDVVPADEDVASVDAGSMADAVASGNLTESAGGSPSPAAAVSSAMRLRIKIKFEVKNGGWGLKNSVGIVSTQDDLYLVRDGASFASDYDITITVPASNKYLNVRWYGEDVTGATYVKAKFSLNPPPGDTIVLDYNGSGNVATRNLYDVRVYHGRSDDALIDWHDALRRSVKD